MQGAKSQPSDTMSYSVNAGGSIEKTFTYAFPILPTDIFRSFVKPANEKYLTVSPKIHYLIKSLIPSTSLRLLLSTF